MQSGLMMSPIQWPQRWCQSDTIKQAVFIAAILEFSGAFFFGKMVTETIQKGIVKADAVTDSHAML
jgi:phosphate/sulfate permease